MGIERTVLLAVANVPENTCFPFLRSLQIRPSEYRERYTARRRNPRPVLTTH